MGAVLLLLLVIAIIVCCVRFCACCLSVKETETGQGSNIHVRHAVAKAYMYIMYTVRLSCDVQFM